MRKYYSQFEATTTDVKMMLKMVFWSLFIGVIVAFISMYVSYKSVNKRFIEVGFPGTMLRNYIFNAGLQKINLGKLKITPEDIFKKEMGSRIKRSEYNKYIKKIFVRFKNEKNRNLMNKSLKDLKKYKNISLLVIPIWMILFMAFFIRKSLRIKKTEYKRGAKRIKSSELKRKLENKIGEENIDKCLKLCKLPIPIDVEIGRFLILGSTQSGKSVALNQLIKSVFERRNRYKTKERMVIVDYKGEFVQKHFDPKKDRIFYPYDKRSVGWSFFNEIENYVDFDLLAESLYQVPEQDKRNEYWYMCAKDVFRMGLISLWENSEKNGKTGKVTNDEIVKFFNLKQEIMVKDYLEKLPITERAGLKHLSGETGERAGSVLSILEARLSFFRYLIDRDGDFSFKKYVRGETDIRDLYILNLKKYGSTFNPLITFVIDTISREILSKEDTKNHFQGIFHLVLDEFGTLGKLSSIIDFLTNSASKGGRMWVVNQDLGTIEKEYGKNLTRTILNNMKSKFIMNLNDDETAKTICNIFGKKEVIEQMENRQMGVKDYGDRVGLSQTEKTKDVVMSSELSGLKDFEGFIKMKTFGLSKVKVPKIFYPNKNKYFEEIKGNIGKILKGEINYSGENKKEKNDG